MQSPIRTRRLSIAAIVSCTVFSAIAVGALRNDKLWHRDGVRNHREIYLASGCITYWSMSNVTAPDPQFLILQPSTGVRADRRETNWSFAGFSLKEGTEEFNKNRFYELIRFHALLWPMLPFALVVPLLWLIARPTKAAAFPVVTDAKHPSV